MIKAEGADKNNYFCGVCAPCAFAVFLSFLVSEGMLCFFLLFL